jgi:hypothetical protein
LGKDASMLSSSLHRFQKLAEAECCEAAAAVAAPPKPVKVPMKSNRYSILKSVASGQFKRKGAEKKALAGAGVAVAAGPPTVAKAVASGVGRGPAPGGSTVTGTSITAGTNHPAAGQAATPAAPGALAQRSRGPGTVKTASPFCEAFLGLCASQGLSAEQTAQEIVKTAALDPAIAREWQGFQSQFGG